jgi:hypothetical protein
MGDLRPSGGGGGISILQIYIKCGKRYSVNQMGPLTPKKWGHCGNRTSKIQCILWAYTIFKPRRMGKQVYVLLASLRSWALLENPPIVELLKNFPAFYGTRRFITVFTRALHWSLSWARSIQSIPPHPTSLRSILILSTHLRLGLPSGLFPSGFPINIVYAFLLSPFVLYACPSHPPWLDHSNYVWRGVQVMKLLNMQFSPISRHFISLRSKYSILHIFIFNVRKKWHMH